MGIAPRWLDLLLLLATLVIAFVSGSGLIGLLAAESWVGQVVGAIVAIVAGALVLVVWWWSNNFRHRVIDDGQVPENPRDLRPNRVNSTAMEKGATDTVRETKKPPETRV
ncbi:MAG: hypothetical protein AAF743_04660 [Planctomycetota bacterium]